MFDFNNDKELVACSKPPVNGNICEKFIAIDTNLTKLVMIWSDELNGFAIEATDVIYTYEQLECDFDKFVWVKNGK